MFGFWFRVDTPMRLRGARYFMTAGTRGVVVAEIWDSTQTFIEAAGINSLKSILTPAPADQWQNIWFRPGVHLVSGEWHLLSVMAPGGKVWRSDGALDPSDVVVGHITVPHAYTDDEPGGRYFLDSTNLADPPNNTTFNLYGVDILVDDLYA